MEADGEAEKSGLIANLEDTREILLRHGCERSARRIVAAIARIRRTAAFEDLLIACQQITDCLDSWGTVEDKEYDDAREAMEKAIAKAEKGNAE